MVNGDRRSDPARRSGRHSTASSSGSRATRATACSSSATGSRSCPPCSATTWRRCPTSRPRSARRPARSPASRRSRCTSPTTTSSTPGDTPNVLVAMNPAALKANLRDMTPGLDAADQRRHVRHAQPRQGGLRAEPAARRLARRVPRVRGADDLDHGRGDEAARREAARRGALEELLRARPDLRGCTTGRPSRSSTGSRTASPTGRGARGEHRRVPRRLQLRRDRRAVRPPVRGQARAARSPGEYRNITGNVALSYGLVAAAQAAKLPLFYASYPITPASDILHELSKLKNFGVKTLQAEDEIAAAGVAIGAAFAGNLAITGDERSRRRPQVRGDRPRDQPRAADGHRRRAARRSVDRPADQDRAGRPDARDVRPARRGAAADRRRAVAGRLLRRRVRGGAHRARSTARR